MAKFENARYGFKILLDAEKVNVTASKWNWEKVFTWSEVLHFSGILCQADSWEKERKKKRNDVT